MNTIVVGMSRMPSPDLQHRVEMCRQDFEAERGRPFDHFFCPILHCDQDVELCKGHVIPDAFGTCRAWVPQRKDVDNFFGSVAEADFLGVVQDRGKSPFDLWIDRKTRSRHRPRLEHQCVNLDYYFPKRVDPVAGQTIVHVAGDQGERLCDVVVKASRDQMMNLVGEQLQIVIDQNFRAAIVASVLKAAHLTLFKMLGYRYVFSAGGQYLADILSRFYLLNHGSTQNVSDEVLSKYFGPLGCMISPMMVRSGTAPQGTVLDNQVLACVGATQGVFALGVVVKAADDLFCVFLPPNEGKAIDTYSGFLLEPPRSVLVKILRYYPGEAEETSCWEIGPDAPVRIPLPDSLPDMSPPSGTEV
ncbi:MAG: hypothetical protein NTY19_06725 [Planctomycetota bacterium]|nr:hypothetical protein [Planctomycetota bacterium]